MATIKLVLALLMQTAQAICPAHTNEYKVHLSDSFGDGWNGEYNNTSPFVVTPNHIACRLGQKLFINDCEGVPVDAAHPAFTLTQGFENVLPVCFPKPALQQYTVQVKDGSWGSEATWQIKDSAGAQWLQGTGTPFLLSTCPTPAPTGCPTSMFSINMSDDFGDGWNGNTISIMNCAGQIMKQGITLIGAAQSKQACLNATQFRVSCGGGTYQTEAHWDVRNAQGVVVLQGGAPSDVSNCPSPVPELCATNNYTVTLSDSYGDGWNGNTMRVIDCIGAVLQDGLTLSAGHVKSVPVCWASEQFHVQVTRSDFVFTVHKP